jgi:hypothetical protein
LSVPQRDSTLYFPLFLPLRLPDLLLVVADEDRAEAMLTVGRVPQQFGGARKRRLPFIHASLACVVSQGHDEVEMVALQPADAHDDFPCLSRPTREQALNGGGVGRVKKQASYYTVVRVERISS